MTAAEQEQPVDRTPVEMLDDLLTEISKHLRNLVSWVPLIRELADTHRETADDYIRTRSTTQAPRRDTGLNGIFAQGTSYSRAPGNMTSWSLEAEVTMTIKALQRFVLRQQPELARPVPANESTEDLIWRFASTVRGITQMRVATAVKADVEPLATSCQRTLFGEDRFPMPSPCPHCGTKALVVYPDSGVIRCERAQRPNVRCRCLDMECPCHTRAVFEHHWLRNRSADHPHSWPSLAKAMAHPTQRSSR